MIDGFDLKHLRVREDLIFADKRSGSTDAIAYALDDIARSMLESADTAANLGYGMP